MTDHRFWVLGGEYISMGFNEMIAGTEIVVGPLASHDLAERFWRQLSERHRANAAMRFSILTEKLIDHDK
jgi:hypothetical protein